MNRFSVLLPTRNRLKYLQFAVDTVLRQDDRDWELILADNCSEDDIQGFAASLHEPRVRYFRTESFIPVTDNWNFALGKSSGDYVIMLGDDDCLLKGYLSTARRLLEEYAYPDLIYTNAYLYVYPGVMPHSPTGYTARWRYDLFEAGRPYFLDRDRATELVRKTLNFEVGFGWNMQFSLVSRRLIEELRKSGPFYQSPYPDYYCTNTLFLKADRILVYPSPMVAIGMTRESFGGYYFSDREKEGVAFLKNTVPADFQNLAHLVLPGEQHNTSWLYAVETVCRNWGGEYPDLRVNYRRYRFLQIYHSCKLRHFDRRLDRAGYAALQRLLSWRERLCCLGLRLLFRCIRLLHLNSHNRAIMRLQHLIGQYPPNTVEMVRVADNYADILGVFEGEPGGGAG